MLYIPRLRLQWQSKIRTISTRRPDSYTRSSFSAAVHARYLGTTTTGHDSILNSSPTHIGVLRRKSDGASKASHHDWELTVGIEIHAQLNTSRKLFSSAATSVNDAANSHVAICDVGLPGAQPLFQKETVVPAIRAALALNCQINRISTFDRKHYFYQDQPAGYQITQCYEPLASNGNVILFQHDGIAVQDGDSIQIGIKQVQLEQDTAKSIQQPPSVHLLDFNRVSHPLLEIISLPHIHHPETAAAFVRKVQSMLKSVDAAVLGMEMGGFRADVNVSVRRRGLAAQESDSTYHGVVGLGQRTEIKNLSSVKAVEDAIRAERDRQIRVLESGGVVEGETRGWTIGSTETTKLREKEGEVDYRYMPDPDIRPVIIDENLIRYLRNSLPDLPDQRLAELTSAPEHNLTMTDARTLLSLDDGQRLDYYENVRLAIQSALSNPYLNAGSRVGDVGRVTANWVLHELGSVMAMSGTSWEDNPVPEESMAGIITHLLARLITGKSAKQILYMVFSGDGRSVADIIDQDGLRLTTMSEAAYDELVAAVMEKHRDIVEQIQIKGKMGKIKFLVGQVMRQAKDGSVEAAKVEETLRRLLKIP